MKTHALPYSRKWRQFRFLSKKLNRLIESGQFHLLSKAKQQKLLNRLKELYSILIGVVPKFQLKKALAGAAFLLGLAFTNSATAQTFAAGVSNPFGINLDDFSTPNFVDIDDDGDLDLFISAYSKTDNEFSIKFLENVGTATTPDFTGQQPVDMPFGIQLQGLDTEYLTLIDFADMDNDGDQDLIVGGTSLAYDGTILYYENIGTATQANFGTPVANPFGFQPTYYNAFPDLVDLDNDGDFDLIVTEYYANVMYFENVGTKEAPSFASPLQNPFGISQPSANYAFIEMVDMDGDGDQDMLKMLSGYYSTNIYYQENIGTPTEPAFDAFVVNPFGFDGLGIVAIPHSTDIDDDGDFDVFFGNYENLVGAAPVILFFENTTPLKTNDLLKESTVKFGPNPTVDFISMQTEIIHQNAEINVSIINLEGRIFDQQTIHSVGNQIYWEKNIHHLPSGSYFIRLESARHFGIVPFKKI